MVHVNLAATDPSHTKSPRAAVLSQVTDRIRGISGRARVAIDGLTAAGKTTFGHELGVLLAGEGRVVLRASLDDFKRPWRERHLHDRVSGEGYYRTAFDLDAIHRLLLDPARPDGSGAVALCSVDPISQVDHSEVLVDMPDDGVLIVDGVFALREELIDAWDLTIWLTIDTEVSLARGVNRDTPSEGDPEQAEALHRNRYLASELIYIDDVDPIARADIVIDNTDIQAPILIRS